MDCLRKRPSVSVGLLSTMFRYKSPYLSHLRTVTLHLRTVNLYLSTVNLYLSAINLYLSSLILRAGNTDMTFYFPGTSKIHFLCIHLFPTV